jgi:hypothetical protein
MERWPGLEGPPPHLYLLRDAAVSRPSLKEPWAGGDREAGPAVNHRQARRAARAPEGAACVVGRGRGGSVPWCDLGAEP